MLNRALSALNSTRLGKTFGDLILPMNSKPAKSGEQSNISKKNKGILSDIVKAPFKVKVDVEIMVNVMVMAEKSKGDGI